MTAWSVKGVDQATRDIARRAANAAGMTIGEWIDHAIQNDAASRGVSLTVGSRHPVGAAATPPPVGVNADTAEAVFSRLEDGERLLEDRLRPIGFALKEAAERLVALESHARSTGPAEVADASRRPLLGHDLGGDDVTHQDGRQQADARERGRALPDGPPEGWSPEADIDRARLSADAGGAAPRPEPVAPVHDFEADPIDVSALGLTDVAERSDRSTGADAGTRRGRRAALAAAAVVIVAVSGAVGWAVMRQGPIDWRALSAQDVADRLAATPEILRADGRRLWAALDIESILAMIPGLAPDESSDTARPDGADAMAPAASSGPDDTVQSASQAGESDPAVSEMSPAPAPETDDALESGPQQISTLREDTTAETGSSLSVAPAEVPTDDPPVVPPVVVVPEVVDPRPVAPPPAPTLTDPAPRSRSVPRGTAPSSSASSSPSSSPSSAASTGQQARADAGDPAAQFNVAIALMSAEPANPAEAATWFREAAINGLAVAQFNLGVLYEQGLGTAKDDTRALLWYHSAAEQNFAPAQHNLGRLYAEGRGIPRSDVEARRWLQRATDGGIPAALYGLAVLEADVADREKRMRTAAEAGDPTAQAWLRARTAGADAAARPAPAEPLILTPPAGASLVSDIQRALQARGYYEGTIDGIAGPVTRSAIARFQAENGLPATGLPSTSLQRFLN